MKAEDLAGGSQGVLDPASAACVCHDVREVENARAHAHVSTVAGPGKDQRHPVCVTGHTDVGSLLHGQLLDTIAEFRGIWRDEYCSLVFKVNVAQLCQLTVST